MLRLSVHLPVLLPVLLLGLLGVARPASGADDGFGGGASSPGPAPPGPAPAQGDCVIQSDDGRWLSCAEVLEAKAQERDRVEAEREVAREAARGPAPQEPPAAKAEPEPPPRRISDMEKDIVKAGIDPTLPIVALRIRAEELKEEIGILEAKGYGPGRRTELEAELAKLQILLEDVETLALGRMMACLKESGTPFELKRIHMTPAGPVRLGLHQLLAQLPSADAPPCIRIYLVDQEAIDKVARAHEVFLLLRRSPFGYHQLDERRKAEAELKDLEAWLAKEGVAPMKGRIRS